MKKYKYKKTLVKPSSTPREPTPRNAGAHVSETHSEAKPHRFSSLFDIGNGQNEHKNPSKDRWQCAVPVLLLGIRGSLAAVGRFFLSLPVAVLRVSQWKLIWFM